MIANSHAGVAAPLARCVLPRWPAILCPLVLLAVGGVAGAQEVNWRGDYVKALKESADSGKPLFVNVGTENCHWCKQLELRTFKDASLVKDINERCVPLKIDATRNAYLVQALRIQSYPTLLIASPNGTILQVKEGFLEAPALHESVVKVLASVGTPDWMNRDFEAANKSIDENDQARAITLLRTLVEDGKDRPIQIRARKLLEALEKQANEDAARAKELASKGKTTEAITAIGNLNKRFPGTLAAREGKQLMLQLTNRGEAGKERKRLAEELLKQAREDYTGQQYLCCLDRCEVLTAQFADLPEADAAGKLAAEIKSNPEWVRQACDQLGERLSVLYLALADSWLKKGQPQQAIFYLERVVKMFPGSRQAEHAQTQLARLRGAPSPADSGK